MKGIFGRKHEKKKKPNGKVFGVSLVDTCTRENQAIPHIIEETVEFLENKGLEVEGIFRIPGNDIIIQKLKNYYNGEEGEIITLENCEDVYAVAGLLKLYLRELSEPIFTHRFYDNFISIQKNGDLNYRYSNFRKLISALPTAHKQTLQFLFTFFIKIPKFADKNKMGEANLAIVLGPNLLRPRHESMLRMIEDARHVNAIIELFLREFEYFILQTNNTLKEVENMKNLEANNDKKNKTSEEFEIVEFDLENPLRFVQQNLSNLKIIKSSKDINEFSIEQCKEEKMAIKIQLRNFETAYKSKFGIAPTSHEKNSLRVFYQFYHLLAQSINQRISLLIQEEVAEIKKKAEDEGQNIEEMAEVKTLQKEKRNLQFSIHQFQAKFNIIHGRKINSLNDRLPIQKDYNRYKEIKLKLAKLLEGVEKVPKINASAIPIHSNINLESPKSPKSPKSRKNSQPATPSNNNNINNNNSSIEIKEEKNNINNDEKNNENSKNNKNNNDNDNEGDEMENVNINEQG